ncbi:MAG: DEAD/DEAH box helicase [Candidatus Nanoarchaeia archaeon]|jgi:ATP-dependent Lhr-like helicase
MIDQELYKILTERGVTELTAPQKQAIPKILSGKDVLLCAPTGYGKTLAVMIPIFDKMIKNRGAGLKTLYITPLRALNRNIFDRMLEIGNAVGLRVEIRHGDTTQYQRKKQADNPPDMLITTPETLQAIFTGSKLREALKTVETVIVDEVHELINSKRGAQLSIGIQRLKKLINKELQMIGLSATVNNKKDVADWLSNKCEIVDVEGDKKYDIKIVNPEINDEDNDLAAQLHTRPAIARTLKMISEIVKENKCIIFVNTRELAENISSRLRLMNIKDVGVHHSSLSKDSRVDTEDSFKDGQLKGIISTSSLELGIDIGDIDLVIQFNSPRQVNKLVQRVGRAGHTSAKTSKGIIIVTNKSEADESQAILKKVEEKWVEESPVYYKPLDVLAHQIVGFCLDDYKPKIKDVYDTIKKAKPYESLTWDEFISVIDTMNKIRILFTNDDGTLGISKKGRFYYFNNLSTIPHEKNFRVINLESNSQIGTLHEGFVASNCQSGNVFICRAQPWEVINVEDGKVNVSRSFDYDSAVPSWEGELIPIHKEVAEQVGKMKGYKRLLEVYNNNVIITTYFGSKVNQTLSEIMAYFLSLKKETTIGIKNDAYRIVFNFKDAADTIMIESLLKEIKPSWLGPVAYEAVKNSNAFMYRFMHVAKRFGVISKDTEYNSYRLKKILEGYENTVITKEAYKEMLVEKLDLEESEKAITIINNGQLKMVEASKETIDELSTGFRDFSNPKTTKEIMDVVKERLLNTHYWYYCLNCGKFVGKLMVRDVKNLTCACGSKLITFFKQHENVKTALVKKMNNEPLTKEESKWYKNLEDRASMFINYDYMAPYTVSGRGVGVRTALRILKGFYKTEVEFLKRIIEAEKQFIKTKKYWMKK